MAHLGLRHVLKGGKDGGCFYLEDGKTYSSDIGKFTVKPLRQKGEEPKYEVRFPKEHEIRIFIGGEFIFRTRSDNFIITDAISVKIPIPLPHRHDECFDFFISTE